MPGEPPGCRVRFHSACTALTSASVRGKQVAGQCGCLAGTSLKFRDKSVLAFLKVDLTLGTTADMAVGSVVYSWQEGSPEKMRVIQEMGSLPRAPAERGEVSGLGVRDLY